MSFSNVQTLALRVSLEADTNGDRATSVIAGLIKELAVAMEADSRDIKNQIRQLQDQVQRLS